MKKRVIAALVPAHDEGAVLEATLIALKKQFAPEDIYVVDDKSSDNTSAIAALTTGNVLKLRTNRGKAGAINSAIKKFELIKKYDFLLFMDADTQPSPDFVERCLPHFENDTLKKIACVVGRVQGLGGSWVSKYRIWEYALAHSVHKSAQAHWNSILVVPGCATIYRTDIFNDLEIPDGTLTEDMDFTFLLHRKGFSKMIFEDKAVVYTQDPQTITEFIKQVNRWYTGFWQAVRKHELPWHGQNLDFEVMMLATEGLLNGLVTVFLILTLPLIVYHRSLGILGYPIAIDFVIFFIPTLLWASWKTSERSLLLYFPHFYFLRYLTSLLFLKSFFYAYLSIEKVYIWNTKRYDIKH